MAMEDDADDLVPFQDVRVIRSTAPALFCRIGDRYVWLSRSHISGKLWSTGDRGKLYVRRWLARDRQLIDLDGAPASSRARSISPSGETPPLHLVRRDRDPSSCE